MNLTCKYDACHLVCCIKLIKTHKTKIKCENVTFQVSETVNWPNKWLNWHVGTQSCQIQFGKKGPQGSAHFLDEKKPGSAHCLGEVNK